MTTKKLHLWDILALGFMTFALFLGAGNIIFPPMVGLSAGDQLWPAALGFLLTGVGLPLLTVVALARVGGGMPALTAPLGKAAGIALGVAVYLCIGPLFATPRTATVSFAMGVAPFVGDTPVNLLIFTCVYFALVLLLLALPWQADGQHRQNHHPGADSGLGHCGRGRLFPADRPAQRRHSGRSPRPRRAR